MSRRYAIIFKALKLKKFMMIVTKCIYLQCLQILFSFPPRSLFTNSKEETVDAHGLYINNCPIKNLVH